MDRKSIVEKIDKLPGKVGFYYKNLTDGTEICYNEKETYISASIIKLPIFMSVMKLVEEGKLNLDDKYTVTMAEKVGGCGAIISFTGDVELDLMSLCRLMITISDNTATNKIIRIVGLEEMGRQFKALGLEKTQLQRYFFDSEAAEKGFKNVVCTEEIAHLFESIANRTFISKEVSEKIEEVLLMQQIRHKIPGYIDIDSPYIANKTGEDDGITHDGPIVYAEKPFILVVTSENTCVPETEKFIRQIALDLYKENGGK